MNDNGSAALHDQGPESGVKTLSRFHGIRRRILHQPLVLFAMAILAALLGMATLGPATVGDAATQVSLTDRFIAPVWIDGEWTHPLGTDALGRDMVARLIFGARVSLVIAGSVVLISGTIGTLLGVIAGYRGGLIDTIIVRLADAQLAFPGFFLVIVVIGILGPRVGVIVGVLSAYGWMIYARLARGIVLQLKESGYVKAVLLMGCPFPRLVRKHLAPGLAAPLITQSMLEMGRMMLAEASISYLGFGIQPPAASWGLMVAENQPYLATSWWTVVFPGLALSLAVISVNTLSNWARAELDPQQQQLSRTLHISRRARG